MNILFASRGMLGHLFSYVQGDIYKEPYIHSPTAMWTYINPTASNVWILLPQWQLMSSNNSTRAADDYVQEWKEKYTIECDRRRKSRTQPPQSTVKV